MKLVGQWLTWIVAGASADLLTWWGLQQIPLVAREFPIGAVLALCWVHGFLLPQLVGRFWKRPFQIVLGAGAGLLITPIVITIGFVVGVPAFFVVSIVSIPLSLFANFSETTGHATVTFAILPIIKIWASVATGAAASVTLAVLAAAAIPGINYPRLSWRVIVAAALTPAVALTLFWPTLNPQFGLASPALLIAAAMPSLVLVNWREVIQSKAPGTATPSQPTP